jgi:hypothetical protein
MEPTEKPVVKFYCTEGCKTFAKCTQGYTDSPCVFAYTAEGKPTDWQGTSPPPAHWYHGACKVYRSYADYCDD